MKRVRGFEGGAGFAGELVEEGIFAVVSGPDGDVEAPGGAALGGFPEAMGVGMFGKLVEADVTAEDGHGLWMSGKGEDSRLVVELDVADFDFFSETGRLTVVVETVNFHELFTVGDNGAGEVHESGKILAEAHVFDGAGIIFGGEEIIAIRAAEAFADVFESVGVGPANANGFFGECADLLVLGAEDVVGKNPVHLVRKEVAGNEGVRVDGDGGEDGGHGGGELNGLNGLNS